MKTKRALMTIGLLFSLCAVTAYGAVIKGKLLDLNGAPQPNLSLKIEDIEKNGLEAKSEADGSYKFENLMAKNWTIKINEEKWDSILLQVRLLNETETVEHNLIAWKIPEFPGDLAKSYQNAFDNFQKNLYTEALADIDVLFNAGQSYYKLYALKGAILFTQNNKIDGIPLLKKAVELNPYESYCNQLLANNAVENKQFSESLTYFEKLLYSTPTDPDLLEQIANSHYMMEKWDKAIEYYKEAAKYYGPSSGSDQTYYFMGASYLKLKQFDNALSSFESFLKASPTSPDAPKIKQLVDKLKEKIAADKQKSENTPK